MSLAAKIRDYDPKQKSADVAHELGCREEYVRAVWQRMCPKKRRRELDYVRNRYHTDADYRRNLIARSNAWSKRERKINPEYHEARKAWDRAYYYRTKNT